MDFLSDGRRRTEATEDLAIGGLGGSSAEEEFWLPPIEGEDKSTNCVTLWQSDILRSDFLKSVFSFESAFDPPAFVKQAVWAQIWDTFIGP